MGLCQAQGGFKVRFSQDMYFLLINKNRNISSLVKQTTGDSMLVMKQHLPRLKEWGISNVH